MKTISRIVDVQNYKEYEGNFYNTNIKAFKDGRGDYTDDSSFQNLFRNGQIKH